MPLISKKQNTKYYSVKRIYINNEWIYVHDEAPGDENIKYSAYKSNNYYIYNPVSKNNRLVELDWKIISNNIKKDSLSKTDNIAMFNKHKKN